MHGERTYWVYIPASRRPIPIGATCIRASPDRSILSRPDKPGDDILSFAAPRLNSGPIPQKDKLRVIISAPLDLVESFRRGEAMFRLLDHDQRAGLEPSALARGEKRRFAKSLAVRRVGEHERERRQRMRATELGRVAPKDPGHAAEAQRLDIAANERAGFRAIVDEQREACAARERLEPERAGAGEEVEHARVRHRVAMSMDQDVEQALAQPVGGRADRGGFRARQVPPAQSAADDAHQRPTFSASAGRGMRRATRAEGSGAALFRYRIMGAFACAAYARDLGPCDVS